jgi:diguanylate cyclase (GGDEF)-like protein
MTKNKLKIQAKEKLVENVFILLTLSAPILAIISVLRSVEFGWTMKFSIDIGIGFLFMSLFSIRGLIPSGIKSTIIVISAFTLVLTSQLTYGLFDFGIIYIPLLIIYAFSCLHKIWVIFCIVGMFLMLALVNYLYIFGIIQPEIIATAAYTQSSYSWLVLDSVLIFSVVFISLVLISNKRFTNSLVARLEKKNKNMRRRAKEMEVLAMRDLLTKLPNRKSFMVDMPNYLNWNSEGEYVGLLCINVDNFKQFNETFGHELGDVALIQLSRLISENLELAMLYRIGGDEFMLVLPKAKSIAQIFAASVKIMKVQAENAKSQNRALAVQLSVGMAVYPKDANTVINLVKAADFALYCAKSSGKKQVFIYEENLSEMIKKRREIERNIAPSLAQNHFQIYFQPVVEMDTGRVVSHEALLRWKHPDFGIIPNGDYINVAERSGQIVDIDEWVMNECLRKIKAYKKEGEWYGRLAINLSVNSLNIIDYHKHILSVVEKHGVDINMITFEVTEYVSAAGDAITNNLTALRSYGFWISIDDFGTGYSSLSRLYSFPVDQVKLDRSFLENILVNKRSEDLVKSILGMVKALDLLTIIEGLETKEQVDKIISLGYKVKGQGYYLGRPTPDPTWDVSDKFQVS